MCTYVKAKEMLLRERARVLYSVEYVHTFTNRRPNLSDGVKILSRIMLCFALLCFFNLLTWTCLHAHYQTNKNQNAKPESETREIKTGFKLTNFNR